MAEIEIPEEAHDRAWIEVASVRDASPRRPDDADTGDVVDAALEAAAPLIVAAWAEQVATDMPYPAPTVDSYSQGRRDAQDHLIALASVLRGEGRTDGE